MPKAKKNKKAPRHDPLAQQINDEKVKASGAFREHREEEQLSSKERRRQEKEEMRDGFVSDKMSKKILEQVSQQQKEMEDEGKEPELAPSSSASSSSSSASSSAVNRTQARLLSTKNTSSSLRGDNDDDDADDDLYNPIQDDTFNDDIELSAEDEKALSLFMPKTSGTSRTLADIIMDKIKEKEARSAEAHSGESLFEAAQDGDINEVMRRRLDPKVIEVYSQVGHYMSYFTSGKIPKAFKIIPTLRNWEEVLFITEPEKWTPQAIFVATRLFASNLNPKMAQRFYNLVLLPRVRDNIAQYKKLNYHLYQAVMKSIYKPASFFKGILLPLADDGCSPREALIMCSILSKCSIPVLHASVALLKLSQMSYSGPTVIFMKTLMNKKYSLPYKVIDSLVNYFAKFGNDRRDFPVIWHQTLLTFIQRYKNVLKPKQKQTLKFLLRNQVHHAITPETRRELFAQPSQDGTITMAASSSSSSSMMMM